MVSLFNRHTLEVPLPTPSPTLPQTRQMAHAAFSFLQMDAQSLTLMGQLASRNGLGQLPTRGNAFFPVWLESCVFKTAVRPSSLVIYNKILSTPDTVYVIGVSKSFASYTLHLTSLLPSTGEVLSDIEVPSSIAKPPHDVILLAFQAPRGYTARIAWLEDGQIKSKALTPDLKSPVNKVKDLVFDRVVDVGVSNHGAFVGIKKGVPTRILKISEDGTAITSLGELDSVPVLSLD